MEELQEILFFFKSLFLPKVCPEGKFRCNTGRCLAPPLVCDGYDDCGDLSDELNCGESLTHHWLIVNPFMIAHICMFILLVCVPVCDLAHEHRCADGRCVSRDWLCDGDHDCLDKSDELNCCEFLVSFWLAAPLHSAALEGPCYGHWQIWWMVQTPSLGCMFCLVPLPAPPWKTPLPCDWPATHCSC